MGYFDIVWISCVTQAPSRLQKMLIELQDHDITLAGAISHTFPLTVENDRFEQVMVS